MAVKCPRICTVLWVITVTDAVSEDTKIVNNNHKTSRQISMILVHRSSNYNLPQVVASASRHVNVETVGIDTASP